MQCGEHIFSLSCSSEWQRLLLPRRLRQTHKQALLAEVRQLRQDLQVSLTRIQSDQILLSRLQIQQVAASRASQHLDDARSKLAEVQVVIRSEAAEIKHYEDAPNSGDHAAQVEDALNRARPTSKLQRFCAATPVDRNGCRTADANGAGQTRHARITIGRTRGKNREPKRATGTRSTLIR